MRERATACFSDTSCTMCESRHHPKGKNNACQPLSSTSSDPATNRGTTQQLVVSLGQKGEEFRIGFYNRSPYPRGRNVATVSSTSPRAACSVCSETGRRQLSLGQHHPCSQCSAADGDLEVPSSQSCMSSKGLKKKTKAVKLVSLHLLQWSKPLQRNM